MTSAVHGCVCSIHCSKSADQLTASFYQGTFSLCFQPIKTPQPQQPRGIGVVNLLQHFVWQENTIDPPKALLMMRLGSIKILVVSLHETVVQTIRVRLRRRICAEHDAILVLEEETPTGIGLPTEFIDPCVDVDVEVRIPIKPFSDGLQVLGVVAKMSSDKRGVWVFCDRPIPLFE